MSRAKLQSNGLLLLQSLLMVSLLLRSLIAPGYMPQPFDEASPLALCHSGLSAPVAQQLFGDDSSHHHHGPHDHQAHFSDQTHTLSEGESVALTSAELCPLGDGLNDAVASPATLTIAILGPTGPSPIRSSRWVRTASLSPFLARGPPTFSVSS
ncbi:MAG: hypothetical protein AAGJ52_11285 [Pseudomonadota bacterium]